MNEKLQEGRIRERLHTFLFLMLSGGFMGAYSYILKGGVFANAETANCLLFAVHLARAEWNKALVLVFPITTYFIGSAFSEFMKEKVGSKHKFTWETIVIASEMLILFFVGFLPSSAPFVISHVLITFVSSIQYNTFRLARGVNMSTVFCTAHLRQSGVNVAKAIMHKDKEALKIFIYHTSMILIFILGAFSSAFATAVLKEKAIWISSLILSIVFLDLLIDDLKANRGKLINQKA